MKKTNLLLASLATMLFFVACRDQDTNFATEPLSQNQVRFDAPEVGQTSRYLRFKAGSCPGQSPAFTYLQDTLVVEVTKVEGTTVTLTERLTPGSASVQTSDPYDDPWGGGTADITLKLSLDNGTAKLLESSDPFGQTRLFTFPNLVLPLAPIASPAMTLEDWYPKWESGPNGYLVNYTQLTVQYDRVNAVTDYEPMAWDGAGGLYLYTAEFGMIRSGHRSGWCQSGEGWDLMPE